MPSLPRIRRTRARDTVVTTSAPQSPPAELSAAGLTWIHLDAPTLTRMMLFEYMIGNTDFSIWALHNVRIVQDRARKLFPVPYDFDLSGFVHAPYATPDPRIGIRSVLDRLYREIRPLRIYEGTTEIQKLIIGSSLVR